MEMLTLEFVGTLRFQVAELLLRAAVEPSTAAVLPTNPSACVDCAVCCSETSVLSESLVLSCCSTPANCTSCWVIGSVSSRSSGFCFCNCVVRSVRKDGKLPASVAPEVELKEELEDEAGCFVVPETIGLAVVAAPVVVMSVSSDPDIDAAARSEHAAIALSRDCRGDGIFVADHQPLRVAWRVVAAVLAGRRLVAQAELQAAVAGLESGVVERLLQLRCVLAQHRQCFRLFDRQMRSDVAIAVDIDANIDAGRIEPYLEPALAAVDRGRALECEPAHGHCRVRRRRDAQWRRGSERGCGGGRRGVQIW